MQTDFEFRLRVRYGECDAQHVVFNARYADYIDVAITEYLRPVLGGVQAMLAQGIDTQVVHLSIDWQAPARFDDVIALHIRPERVGNSSYALSVRISRLADGRELAQAKLVYVLVAARSHEKLRIDELLRQRLLAGAPGVLVDQSGSLA
jgi:acyl-CoA thioester hydrolase